MMKWTKRMDPKVVRRVLLRLAGGALLALLLAFAAGEMYLRHRFTVQAERDIDLWRAIVYSDTVWRRPDTVLGFRFYGLDGEPLIAADVKRNNIGLISRHDYSPEKVPGEFRIVVLGGEQTASSVVNTSWPDALQDELARRFPGRKFRVFNFGWPDAGPEHYIDYWQKEAKGFEPDLVIVNYPETDFYRTAVGAKLTFQGKDLEFSKPYKKVVDGQVFQMLVAATVDNKAPITLDNPLVIASRPYGIFPETPHVFIPIEVLNNRAQITRLQREIVGEQIAGALPAFGTFALRWLKSPTQKLFPRVSETRNFDPPPATVQDEKRLVAFGEKHFGWIQRNIPNVMLLHTFHAGEMDSDFRLTREMTRLDPAIKVVDMRTYVPKAMSREELATWYLAPHMGEKFSEKGHQGYAGIVIDMLCERGKLPVSDCRPEATRK